MKKSIFVILVLMGLSMATADCPGEHPKVTAYDGWKPAVQMWSFRKFTLFEGIDKTRSLGLSTIQAFPGQTVSKEIDVKFGPHLTTDQRQQIKDKLADAGISIAAFGVTGVPKKEAQARKLFEFAVDMGIGVIASEPKEDQFEMIDTLCQEYKVKLAVHNHPKPSHYWNPDTVLKVCQGRSKWIGACTDVGHWVRSGLDPVECLKKLEGRIVDVHTKEIDNGHDVVWGSGQGRMKGILEELHRQGYRGTFTVEYEYNWDNNVPEIRQSIAYFDSVASTLNPTGWKPVFKDDLSNATMKKKGSWVVEDGEIIRKGGGDLCTSAKYSDFVLDFEFMLEEGTNSGVFLRAATHGWIPWLEVQIQDDFGQAVNKHTCGGIFDIKEPAVHATKPAGQWNRMTIAAKGSKICVVLNHQKTIDIDLDDWPEAGKNPDGTKNKFKKIAYKDLPREGWISFQDHGQDVRYRNIRIKEL